MNEISVGDLYDLYHDGIQRCSSGVLSLSDEEMEYSLYEEFDCVAISFLHDDSLRRLHDSGLIGKEAVFVSKEIRRVWLQLLSDGQVAIGDVRMSCKWRQIFSLCDKLLGILDS